MCAYQPTWVTSNLAVGHAPMSYEELDSIKELGITAIVNLCGEFSDLHEIEEKAGFEVFWIPIPDETAPRMAEMEEGLEWLDEAVYLGKKVLVHCRHGIGRTGTFVTAYLLRRGFGLKNAGKLLKATRANPTNFTQWWLLRKFGKKEGQLKLSEPTSENRNSKDLSAFFKRYEDLLARVDALSAEGGDADNLSQCMQGKANVCGNAFSLELIEALYLHSKINVTLPAQKRRSIITRAVESQKSLAREQAPQEQSLTSSAVPENIAILRDRQSCPLSEDEECLLHNFRPIHCRIQGHNIDSIVKEGIEEELAQLSIEVFSALFNIKLEEKPPLVNSLDSLSGKFIQSYFQYLASRKQ
jgi:protein-tyrosine phosphatase